MLGEIKATLEPLPVSRVLIFGSVARGQESDRSDLDLFVRVRDQRASERVKETLLDLRLRFSRRYGTDLSPVVYTEREWRDPPNPELLANIDRDGIALIER